jgi:hypothetical protein
MKHKPLVGNKGEWSELYTFLKLLADGKLYAADKNLEKMPDIFYPIVSIIRQEVEKNLNYNVNESTISIFDNINDTTIASIPTIDFVNYSKHLLDNLKRSKGRSVTLPELDAFLSAINVGSLSDSKGQKSDIRLIAHDPKTAMLSQFGFSIKSLIGQDSTLFNAGAGTNFIYEVVFPENVVVDIAQFNRETLVTGKIATRLAKIEALDGQLKFHAIQSKRLQLNLTLIDTALPLIL